MMEITMYFRKGEIWVLFEVAVKKEACINASPVFHNYAKYQFVLYNKAIP